jgi:23S rRNA pseudouridine1911/1915/1917 synthase
MNTRRENAGARGGRPREGGASSRGEAAGRGREPVVAEAPGRPQPKPDATWTVPPELGGRRLEAVVKALSGRPWSDARELVASGKIAVGGETERDEKRAMVPGETLELRLRAPRPRTARLAALAPTLIVYADAHVVVVRKPAGINTVPFGDELPDQRGQALDELVRDVLSQTGIAGRDRGAPLGVVQRLDKDTSGLLVFARTFGAKKHLAQQLRQHTVHRRYLGVAYGDVRAQTIRTHLVDNRGDGLRGSAEAQGRREGQLAVTHVEVVERLRGATLVGCRLETGRTHQIRVHLSEAGHPLVGERVYIRGFRGAPIEAPRILLHAAELGFDHPLDDRPMRFEEPPPADFLAVVERLRRA